MNNNNFLPVDASGGRGSPDAPPEEKGQVCTYAP